MLCICMCVYAGLAQFGLIIGVALIISTILIIKKIQRRTEVNILIYYTIVEYVLQAP